jgi:hypothetical protein
MITTLLGSKAASLVAVYLLGERAAKYIPIALRVFGIIKGIKGKISPDEPYKALIKRLVETETLTAAQKKKLTKDEIDLLNHVD